MPAVVFVTAHEEHALRAFDVDAVDYMLKPSTRDRFAAALGRVREELEHRQLRRGGERKKPLDRLPLRSAGRVSFLRVDHVEWVDAAHNYVRIHGVDGHTHLVRGAIGDLEARLDPERFVRIHRSTIVNVDRVRELELTTHGNYVAILEGGQRLTSAGPSAIGCHAARPLSSSARALNAAVNSASLRRVGPNEIAGFDFAKIRQNGTTPAKSSKVALATRGRSVLGAERRVHSRSSHFHRFDTCHSSKKSP